MKELIMVQKSFNLTFVQYHGEIVTTKSYLNYESEFPRVRIVESPDPETL